MSSSGVILLSPHPRTPSLIFSDADYSRLQSLGQLVYVEDPQKCGDEIERHGANIVAVIGQIPMDRARLERTPKLKAIFNVEGNFLPNIDYEYCHQRNIPVLGCGPAFSAAVAEMALGLALASARGIVEHDARFRSGDEVYGGASNGSSFLLRGKTMGLIGCGNVGRELLPLLKPFAGASGSLIVHDPWVHPKVLRNLGATPVTLDEIFSQSNVLFVISAATTENKGQIGKREFQRMQPGSVLVLVGRSDVLDFDALLDAAQSGHVRAAIDVFPQEPLPKDHRARQTRNTILSAHRAGGIPETYKEIGCMVVDDLEMILKALPPQRMQRALPETVARYRGRPVSAPVPGKQ